MDRDRIMEIIDSNGRFNLPTVELELLADHLMANGIGDITAENKRLTTKLDILNTNLTGINDSIRGLIDRNSSEIKYCPQDGKEYAAEVNLTQIYIGIDKLISSSGINYMGLYESEKHRADVAEEALLVMALEFQRYVPEVEKIMKGAKPSVTQYDIKLFTNIVNEYLKQAEERLKERK